MKDFLKRYALACLILAGCTAVPVATMYLVWVMFSWAGVVVAGFIFIFLAIALNLAEMLKGPSSGR